MKISQFKPLFLVLLFSVCAFFSHKFILDFLSKDNETEYFYYTTFQIYLYFFICSTILVAALIFVKTKNLDIVGYCFIALTMIKIGIAYFLLFKINSNHHKFLSIEKNSFFITFILFLAMETLITTKILNKKQ